jgi:(p)ppGpp synthase/HD superfamily hydrolase
MTIAMVDMTKKHLSSVQSVSEKATMETTANKLLEQTLRKVENNYDKASIERFRTAIDLLYRATKYLKVDPFLTEFQCLLSAHTASTVIDLSPPISVLITGLLLDTYLGLPTEKEITDFPVDEQVRKLLSNVAELYKYELQLPWRKCYNIPADNQITLQYLRSRATRSYEQSSESIQSTKKQLENHCKLIVSLAETPAALIIKLVDRISVMECLKLDFGRINQSSILLSSIASETLNIHVPMAERLGIWKMKWPLQDLAFSIIMPEEYQSIKCEIAKTGSERDDYLQRILCKIENSLKVAQIPAFVQGRSKSIYSIYHKKNAKNLDVLKMNDLLGVRIIISNEDEIKATQDCYRALNMLINNTDEDWDIPVKNNKGIYDDGKFSRDWIAHPKPNGYQSIHTTIRFYPSMDSSLLNESTSACIDELLVEVQIRTRKMHEVAEYGVAAHWGYKEKEKIISKISSNENKWNLEQEKLKQSTETNDKSSLKFFENERFCLTPKGEVLYFPKDATPIDFAYRIHGEIGNRILSVKVNNQIARYNYKLQNGDVVEIITSKEEKGPKEKWLSQENGFVEVNRTKYKIRLWFRRHAS